MMLKSSAPVAYLVHAVLLNSSALYQRWVVEEGLILVGFLRVKIETCKESELIGEGRDECALYWFTGT